MPIGMLALDRHISWLERWGTDTKTAAVREQFNVAQEVYDRSQVLVPRDTEALAKSGRVTADLTEPELTAVVVEYGGVGSKAEDYAIVVHQDLTARHDPPTSARYLARAVEEIAPSMAMRIGEAVVSAATRRTR